MGHAATGAVPVVDVVEFNAYAPRPFVFTEVAMCLRDSLAAAGWTSRHRFNEVDPQAISIVIGALPPFAALVSQLDPRRTLIANFEQLGSASAIASSGYQRWLRDWVVVDYHSRNVEYLKRHHSAQRAFEIPIVPGSSVAFEAQAPAQPSVDVLFFGSLNDRRTALLEQLRRAGLSVEVVAGAYGGELAPAVRRARVVLHIHFYDTALFPVARVLQPVAAGVPIVCETPVFADLSDWSESGIVFAPYESLVSACRRLLDSPGERQERAARTRAFARTLDFATPLRQALQCLLENPPPATPDPELDDGERLLTNEEIEAILLQEGGAPAEGGTAAVQLVMREPGHGRFGRWIVWLVIVFSFWTIWRSFR
ncbi:MAG TPA: glycosyltransferase [Ramlibacter sp.]|nr:glycosyltransferase [Ramlibacter sp.]